MLRCLAALVGGVVLSLAFEPVGLAVLMPVALAVLVLAVRGLKVRHGALVGWLFGAGFMGTLLWWMQAVGTDAWVALSFFQALYFAPLGMVLALVTRLRAWPVWAAFAWVAVETWRGAWPFGGLPWGRLTYATVDTLWQPLIPWLGMTGVSLLVALTGTTLAWLVTSRLRRRVAALVAVGGLAAVTLLPSLGSYAAVPGVSSRGEELTVAAVQGDVPGDGTDVPAVHRQITANHVALTEQLAADVEAGEVPRPDLVVWPENSTAVDPFTDVGVNAGIVAASDAIGVPILVGGMADSPRPDEVLNQGIVWRPRLGGGDRYTKRHPVPYGEYIPFRGSVLPDTYGQLALIPRDMARGTSLEPLRVGDALVADAICFDIAYDDVVHGQVANGGELVTVQTSNAMFIHTAQIDQQFEISRLRAVETGRYVVVAAINGVSGIVAPDGSVVQSAAPRTQDVLVADVALAHGVTPAVWMGAWPGRAAVAVTILGVLLALVPYRRPARPDSRGQTGRARTMARVPA
ncbi:apolipoprotein N-acyltransferase [Nocardioides sp. Soil805]|uniref:apolipoprotein N-acyltransferase n=1 Tax=Nocardioides sp. Soil805 TaxID=1736416 RepID=UPI0009E6D7B8|nr:apolipoprotein N-acyltransferase [Nocardioides sp. Soil805]